MELKLTPFGIVVSIKEEEAREARRAKALGLTEPQSDSVKVLRQKSPPMGDIDIEITRDFKTITAHVEIAYFRRPEPSTYWIDGDRGDDGEVILGDAVDDWGRELVLSLEEQDEAIEAFKAK